MGKHRCEVGFRLHPKIGDDVMTSILVRTHAGNHGTFGKLYIGSEFFCYTLEPPWHNNEEDISCIPVGEYQVHPYRSPHFKNTYEVLNVPDRSNILFHKGNTISDTQGCVILGSKRGTLNNNPAVLDSRKAFNRFKEIVGNNCFELIVLENYN